MFSHTHNKLNLFEAMNRGSLILINTAKDLLKQEGCEIFGRFIVTCLSQATQERAALPEEKRLPTFIYPPLSTLTKRRTILMTAWKNCSILRGNTRWG